MILMSDVNISNIHVSSTTDREDSCPRLHCPTYCRHVPTSTQLPGIT